MKPLFDEDAEGCSYKSDDEAEEPENVDENCISRSLEGWRGEVWHGGVDEVPIDSETCDLSRKVHENLVRQFFRLLLQVFVRLNDECRDDGREQTGLSKISFEANG